MAKRFTQQEIEVLSENPNVKHVRENRLTLTHAFRVLLWEEWSKGVSINSILEKNGFSKKIVGYKFGLNLKRTFQQYGCPTGGKNKILGICGNEFKNTEEEIQTLLKSGFFIKERNGIAFHPDFTNELFHQYPEVSIEEGLKEKGIKPDIVGYQRIYKLQKLFDGSQSTPAKQSFDTMIIEKLKQHPYIKRITPKQIVFHDAFYQEAQRFQYLHIDAIFDIFEIDHTLLPVSTKTRMKYQLQYKQIKEVQPPITDNTDLMLCIARNQCEAIHEQVEANFVQCKHFLPSFNKQQRKILCQLIQEIPQDREQEYSIRAILSKIGISKSNYYHILKAEDYGEHEARKEEQDETDIELIKQVIDYKSYPKGSRMIKMMMPRLTGVNMGRRKILRLMKKAKMKCPVRKANPHKRASKEMLKRNVKENIVKRQFRLVRPCTIGLTDVSYVKISGGNMCYLSTIKDASSGRILSCAVSDANDEALADATLQEIKLHPLEANAIVHSDQGVLYLSNHYQQQLVDMGYQQSMSRRGNCWDNASQESFFGHFKDECEYSECEHLDALRALIEGYMNYYNEERPQWTRMKMTPNEFEAYLRNMSDEEFTRYQAKERIKYDNMMTNAAKKAKMRAIDIGIEVAS